MKALVVDDEAPARAWLTRLLVASKHFTAIEQAENCMEAKRILAGTKPDVMFLDIGMPRINGMDFATEEANLPPVIFVTAHERFAVRAFEAQAIDYLLKPVTPGRLEQAIQRLLRGAPPQTAQAAQTTTRVGVRIAASYRNELRFIDSQAISHFTADGGYANFAHEGFDYTLDESLSSLGKRLESSGFLRVGRHALVNLNHVRALQQDGTKVAVRLRNNSVIPVSRRAITDIKQAIDQALRYGQETP